MGKQTRNPVSKVWEGMKAEGILGRVHIDLMGPQDVTSVNGHKYIMNFIDDHSSYSWLVPLKDKASAVDALV